MDYRSIGESPKNTVEFQVEEDFAVFGGIALLSCTDRAGHPMIATPEYGDIKPVEIIGLLQTTLDQYRYNFVDRGFNILEDEEDEEDDDLGGEHHR